MRIRTRKLFVTGISSDYHKILFLPGWLLGAKCTLVAVSSVDSARSRSELAGSQPKDSRG